MVSTKSLSFKVSGAPVPKARPRAGRHGFYTPRKTAIYESLVGWTAKKAMDGQKPINGPVAVCIAFTMPIPQSWSKSRKNAVLGNPHASRPDTDNLAKAICDGCNGVIWADDCQIWQLVATKTYGAAVGAVVTVTWG